MSVKSHTCLFILVVSVHLGVYPVVENSVIQLTIVKEEIARAFLKALCNLRILDF